MAEWILKRKSADYKSLSEKLNVDSLIVRIMLNRNIETEADMRKFLYASSKDVYSYSLLDGIADATKILKDKIAEHKKIRIVGDYDVDGVCATTVLLKGLKRLGANVDYYIPNRHTDGYGLNPEIIEKAHEECVDTILTCDNGIAAIDQIKMANEYGMTVIITDHHEIPFDEVDGKKIYKVPEAKVLIDPKLADSKYPFKEICGAVVAYKLIESLLCEEANTKLLLEELFQYSALATVADVMDLVDENRIILKHGLYLMNTRPALGIEALKNLNGIDSQITCYHLGFVLGPSINAAGRLKDADLAVKLLMSETREAAMENAKVLKELNDERKSITELCTEAAIKSIEESDIVNDRIIVTSVDNCNEGVIGIVAGKIKERYHRPSLIVALHDGIYKGSGRSIDEFHLYNALNEVSDCLIQFGGHSGAAGFSLEIDKLDELRRRLNDNCKLADKDIIDKLMIDADMPLSYCDEKLMKQLSMLEPHGNGNSTPRFARNDLSIFSVKLFGSDNKVGKYGVMDKSGRRYELTLFGKNDELRKCLENKYGTEETDKLYSGGSVNMPMLFAYYPKWNEYNGRKTIQFVIVDYK